MRAWLPLSLLIFASCQPVADRQITRGGVSEASLQGDWKLVRSSGSSSGLDLGVRFSGDSMGYFDKTGPSILFRGGGMIPIRFVGNTSFHDGSSYVDYSLSAGGQRLRLCTQGGSCANYAR